MSVDWTEEQLSAIESTEAGTIVSAAAGSGKTAVLIERTIRLLADESKMIPADSLLAVTFTNAAAAQLRDKLSSALNKKAAENPGSKWLALQQSRLQTAKITTINAFCLDIVRNNSHILGLQSGIRIMDENEELLLRSEMLAKAEADFHVSHEAAMRKLTDYLFRNSQQLQSALSDMYVFLRSIPFSDLYMSRTLNRLTSEDGVREYCDELLRDAAAQCVRAKNILERAMIACEKLTVRYKVHEYLPKDLQFVSSLIKILEQKRWDDAFSFLGSHKFESNKKTLTNKEKDSYSDLRQLDEDSLLLAAIAQLRDEAKKIMIGLRRTFGCTFSECVEDCRLSAELVQTLYETVLHAAELMDEEKAARSCCDFADVELMTVKLLAGMEDGKLCRTELCRELVASGEYKVILIDEFQDINNLQELIFKLLSDTDDLEIMGRNVFAVGDVKQAIYGFRMSNPKLFVNARLNASKEKYKGRLREIVLSKNFRSRREVIDLANFMFSRLMSTQVGGVDYSESEQLNYAADYDDSPSPAELLLFDGNEAYAVAKKIRSMLESGFPVYENGKQRKCRPSDFCVLVRTSSSDAAFSEAFESFGLDLSSREIDGYLKSREILLMTSLLKVIDNPMNDVAMLAVMLSPVLGFTAEQAARLKSLGGTVRREKLYSLMSDCADKELSPICKEAVAKLKRFRQLAAAMPVEKLIRRLYIETDLYILSGEFSGGERAQANLRLLLEYASDYDKSYNSGGLSGFIRYLDSVLSSGRDFRQASVITSKNDSVSLLTMHKSKGLEFPIVFICGLKTKFRFDEKDSIVFDENGIGVKITDRVRLAQYPTAAYSAIYKRKKLDIISEELRLLYVAVTRAKEKLVLSVPMSGAHEQPEHPEHFEQKKQDVVSCANSMISDAAEAGFVSGDTVSQAKCMLDWVLFCFAFHKSASCELNRLLGLKLTPAAKEECPLSISLLSGVADDSHDCSEKTGLPECDEELAKTLREAFLMPQLAPSQALAKVSVTEISHKDNGKEAQFFPQIPDISKSRNGFSAAMKGTLTHRFMELCDFKRAKESVREELERLSALGRFTEHEKEGVYIESLERFFDSDLSGRMLSSPELLREKQFMVRLSDLDLSEERFGEYARSEGMVQGIADCLFEEDGGYVLIDYKTDRVEEMSQLSQRYSLQLELYQNALSMILDKPVTSCIIYSLYLGRELELFFD